VEVFEARVARDLGHSERSDLFGDESSESFVQGKVQRTDAGLSQADGRGEHEVRAVGLEQIDRADFGAELACDDADDFEQSFGGTAALLTERSEFFDAEDVLGLICASD
jgi:hypothetical protein